MERDIDVNALAEDLRLFMDEMLFDSRLMDKLFITRYPLFILGKIQDSPLTYEYEGMSQRYFYVNNGKIISQTNAGYKCVMEPNDKEFNRVLNLIINNHGLAKYNLWKQLYRERIANKIDGYNAVFALNPFKEVLKDMGTGELKLPQYGVVIDNRYLDEGNIFYRVSNESNYLLISLSDWTSLLLKLPLMYVHDFILEYVKSVNSTISLSIDV